MKIDDLFPCAGFCQTARLLLLLLSVLQESITGLAQSRHAFRPMGYAAATTYSRQFSDVFSAADNQAVLGKVKQTVTGLASEKRYSLQALTSFRGVLAFPFANGGVALVTDHAGFSAYNESKMGLAFGRALGETIDIGLQFNYYLVRVPGYGNASAVNFEIGSIFHITQDLHTGFHLKNPLGGRPPDKSSAKPAAVYTVGFGYDASERLFLGAGLQKEEDRPVGGSMLLHYTFIKQFFIRGGIAVGSGNSFAGFGLQWKSARLDMAGGFHPQLGFTPSILAVFIIQKNKAEQ